VKNNNRTLKRSFSTLLCLLLLVSLLQGLTVSGLAASAGLDNFAKVSTYSAGQFGDVPDNAWYAKSVASAYEYGLVKGKSETSFSPAGNITIAETLALACRLHSIYNGGSADFTQGSPWYQVYVDYAVGHGIIAAGAYADYTANATRAQFAVILAHALPAGALAEINQIADGAIPDVPASAAYAGEVYLLYRAGVLTGNDDAGTFTPGSNIQRSAVAAIVTRMADTAQRRSVTLRNTALTAEQIYARCTPAVFYIEIYDANGIATASGSGFFIDDKGTAVTNFHVIEGAASAKILLSDTGAVLDVVGVYDYDEDVDWAVLKINGTGSAYLELGDAATVAGGATVYALGSPEGLDSTISEGLISNPRRMFGDVPHIQISAAISHGSSGGALLNKFGQVIGITSSGILSGENLGFALPITVISGYKTDSVTPLSSIVPTYTDQELAAACLYDFVMTNANDTVYGYEMYSEIVDTETGWILYGVYYDEDLDLMCLYYLEDYDGDTYIADIDLGMEDYTHYAYYTYYSEFNQTDTPDFQGDGVMYAPDFDGTVFVFDEYDGNRDLDLNQQIAGETYLDMLGFADYILADYGYDVSALGFTGI
jgi:S1-C subfamily serine protease